MEVGGFGMEPEINPLSCVADNVLCTWVLVVAPLHQFVHPRGKEESGYTHTHTKS